MHESRSRSGSPPRSKSYDRYDKKSRSPSYSKSRSRSFSRSRSPPRYDNKRKGGRYNDRYDSNPTEPCNVMGVFGLSQMTTIRQLEEIFGEYGKVDKIELITDRRTGRSKGFGFVYFDNIDDCTRCKDKCNGMSIDGRTIRTDFSKTLKPHDPTPGIYKGRRTSGYRRRSRSSSYDRYDDRYGKRDRYYDRDHRDRYYDRSRSRSRGRRRSYSPRSRSRSYDRY